jgi:glucose/arabinose dehydrogenase
MKLSSSLVPFATAALAIQVQAAAPTNVVIPSGYTMSAVATGLDFPTAITFQGDSIWVTEAGIITPPAVKEIDNKGNVTTVLTASMLPAGDLVSPVTGITFADGWIWLVHRQTSTSGGVPVGAISKFMPHDPVGTFQTVLSGLPFFGDHPASSIVFGADGRAYLMTGLPTNSSVVGPDNGWAVSYPSFHDFPPVDIELSGIGYRTAPTSKPFALDPTAVKITEPFMPFGGGTVPAGTVVHAATPANPGNGIITAGGGAVYSFDPHASNAASTLRLEGWGFRNDYGLGFDPFNPNLLFVSNKRC